MKVIFLSDLHLGANYISDHRDHEKKICRFLEEECTDADNIYLLGDVLDYWFEYREVVPKGFVRFFGTLARLSDSGVKITWVTGNHDIWLFGYLQEELGIEVIDEPMIQRTIGSKKFVLAHGDRLGRRKLSFRLICGLFRNKVCQRLYASVHPRWTVPFAHRWSSNSRYSHQLADDDERLHCQIIMEEAEQVLSLEPDADYIVIGHHHLTMDEKISATNARVIVLGDWIENFSYAVFDGSEISLKKYLNHRGR